MKIQLQSDRHHEFMKPGEVPDIEDAGADVIILAGDIDTGSERWSAGPRIRRRSWRVPLSNVAGNHEFYRSEVPRLIDSCE